MPDIPELDTLSIHADDGLDDVGAVVAPIFQTVNFHTRDLAALAEEAAEPRASRFYLRRGNPTIQRAASVARLEGAEDALVTASGMAAVTTAVVSNLASGDHVVAQRFHYAATNSLLDEVLPNFGVRVTRVDQQRPEAFAAAAQPTTKLFLLESPSNPLLQLTDLAAVAGIARERGITTIVDQTFASPVNQRPLVLGIDLVVHSATKYLAGHGDVMAGAIVGRRAAIERAWKLYVVFGPVLGPVDAWLLTRGIRTLALRMRRHNENGLALAELLAAHPAVVRVNYPGLTTHPQHDLARRQMAGFGGVLSFAVRGGYDGAARVAGALQLFKRAASLGGVESLITHPAAMWRYELSDDQLAANGLAPDLLRIATGLEAPADLVADLEAALDFA